MISLLVLIYVHAVPGTSSQVKLAISYTKYFSNEASMVYIDTYVCV